MNHIGKTNDVINDPNPIFTTPVETLYEFNVAQLLEIQVYNDEQYLENNLDPSKIIGTLQLYLTEIINAQNQFISRNIKNAQGQDSGEILIKAADNASDVAELIFNVKIPWLEKHSQREIDEEPDGMFFVIEKENTLT